MNKIYNFLTVVVVIFLLPVALAQFPFPFPFIGFAPNNAAPAQQGNYLQITTTYLSTIPDFIQRWLAKDDGPKANTNTADKFPNFVKLGKPPADSISAIQKMNQELIGGNPPADANDYTFTTWLATINKSNKLFINSNDVRQLPQPPANIPNAFIYNYLKTSSGGLLNLKTPPEDSSGAAGKQYKILYKTLMSAITYNNYAITEIFNKMQAHSDVIKKLIEQSTNSDWITNIGGKQDLGVIFRQMLLYISQSFVLQAQMMEMQKAMAMSQVVTNTLLALSIQNGVVALQNTASPPNSAYQIGG